jgi:tetratricopeptide (TPR) repeat protein
VAALALALAIVGGYFLLRKEKDPVEEARAQFGRFLAEVDRLMAEGRFAEAAALLETPLQEAPQLLPLNERMGRCLDQLGYYETGLPIWHRMTSHAASEAEGRVFLGKAYMLLGHSSTALPYLEKPVSSEFLEPIRRQILAECYLDLERYEEALRAAEGSRPDVRLRFRILARLGRQDEAARALDELREKARSDATARVQLAQLEAIRKREDGDFAGARAILEAARAGLEASSSEAFVLTRSMLLVDLEAGDVLRLLSHAETLADSRSPTQRAEALWYRMIGHLEAGSRDDAAVAAKEALERMDRRYGLLRHKLWMFQHFLGQRKDEELAEEAKRVHRFYANEIYYYLALSTEKKAWAEKALESTVGHDFPYHAIRRRLGK